MLLYDQHQHTDNSADSDTRPEDNILAALERGLAGVMFTDHFDSEPSEWPRCIYNYDRIRGDILALREKYGDRIFIGHGVEICYQPARMDFILDFLNRHEFDMVLLSVHWFDGRALHEQDHWGEVDAVRGTELYLKTVADAARMAGTLTRNGQRVFDVLGHIDLVKRYTQRYFQSVNVAPYKDLVDDILRAALASDLVPEVNTSTMRQGVGEPSPAEWIIRRYAELGGTMMTIGSDAHRSEHVGANMPDAVGILQRCGVTHQAVFRNRNREAIPL